MEFDIHKSSPRGELFDDHKMTAHLDYNPDYENHLKTKKTRKFRLLFLSYL